MTVFVLDNSVLSAFHKVGRLGLLGKVLSGHDVIVPDKVVGEVIYPEVHAQIVYDKKHVSAGKWMLCLKSKESKPTRLGAGEQAVLDMARERGGWAVIDDQKARRQAREKRIRCVGTLSLLKTTRRKKLVTKKELKVIVEDLKEKDQFRMTPELEEWLMD